MNPRFYSLDVFRGATVAFMILVNNPGSWSHLFSPLGHADWHGLTPTDLVFPFFLFAVGNALAFVLPRLEAGGDAAFWKKVIRRTVLIFAIGLFLNWFPFVQYLDGRLQFRPWTGVNASGEVSGVRILGVLQRIALCYFFASVIIYYGKARGAFFTGLVLLLVYWALCVAGNPSDPYSLTGWFGTNIDRALIGPPHMYHGERVSGIPYAFDPEGLVSTIPAIVQVIFGFLVGDYIRRRSQLAQTEEGKAMEGPQPMYRTLTVLFLAAAALLFTGYAWGLSFPINKKIWTSSYTALTSGLAIMVLAVLIYAIEVRGARGWWSRFFDVFGKNPLFIYALSGIIPRLMGIIRIPDGSRSDGTPAYTNPLGWFYENVTARVPGPPEIGSLLFALCLVALLWAIGYWMDKKRIYVRV
ncbi:MAG TPA: DUF5009 domain-containing protein [Chitinophagaceae bacterium]|nr:DUF5009 domain-containing protein [Chitinophagaceae bacterium]